MSQADPDTLIVPLDHLPNQDSESTPLLQKHQKPITPLPRLQLSIICLVRTVEPIAFQVIFPFINQMLLDVGAAKDQDSVGYPAGIVESIFSITQMVTIFHWGALSDKIGRKPVLIMGCVGSAISAIAFGFSRTFLAIIITRSLNGMMNGNIAVLKSIMAEIADETNESRAFSFFPMCLNLGTLIASFFGGTFANINNFPRFANLFPIFRSFPYLLPNVLAAIPPILAAIIASIYLKETLPPKQPTSDTDTPQDILDKESTSFRALFTPHINALMFSFAVLSLLGGAQSALQPLFCFTPIQDGGLGFSESEIGTAMSIRAVATIAVQVLAFPVLQRRVGTGRLYRWLMVLWIPTYLGLPVLNLMARQGYTTGVWVGLSITLACSAVANMSFVCNLLMINAAAPSRQLLGSINGYSQVLSSLVRIVGPGGASILYAVSISKQIMGGNLIWLVCGIVAVVGVISGVIIREQPRAF